MVSVDIIIPAAHVLLHAHHCPHPYEKHHHQHHDDDHPHRHGHVAAGDLVDGPDFTQGNCMLSTPVNKVTPPSTILLLKQPETISTTNQHCFVNLHALLQLLHSLSEADCLLPLVESDGPNTLS